MNDRYRVLILHSMPGETELVTAIASVHFDAPTVLFWEMGNAATKPEVLAAIEACDYNLIISYVNGIILKPAHLRKARYGAVNIHPAPPEHGGCWGLWCQPVVNRERRTHHGVTVHEIDDVIDHGPIYRVERWDVPATASIAEVAARSAADCQEMLRWVCREIAAGDQGSRCFARVDEHWDPDNRHTPVSEIRRWFAALDPAHPAHAERVFLNHPRAIISPPYFDDL
ncbi:MAG: formyltransferase family protein [Gammaproteobacteria bacterium]